VLSDRKMFETTVPNIFNTIKLYLARHPIKDKLDTHTVYDSRAFKGDNLMSEFIKGSYKLEVKEHPLKILNADSPILKGLKEYKDYFDKKQVQFFLTPPVIIEGYFEEDKIMPFWKFVSQMTDIPLLNNDRKYSLEKKYFFNSHYHPNYEGRKIRTTMLIEDILKKNLVNSSMDNFQ